MKYQIKKPKWLRLEKNENIVYCKKCDKFKYIPLPITTTEFYEWLEKYIKDHKNLHG